MKATGSSPLRRMTSLTMLLSLAIAACVAPAPAPTPIPTNTHSATPLPTSTFTPSPTPTFTVTPTPDPEQIAEALGLPFENGPSPYKHSYRIEGDNLMDYLAPIPAIAAQRVNGEWRAVTDDTVKYGALADSLGYLPIQNVGATWGWSFKDVKSMSLYAVFTGEWRVEDWFFSRQNKTIRDFRGKVVFRGTDEEVYAFWVSAFSPDIESSVAGKGASIIFRPFYINQDGRNSEAGVSLEKALELYEPGQKWRMSLQMSGPQMPIKPNTCYERTMVCEDERNRMTLLRSENAPLFGQFVEGLLNDSLTPASVPEELVLAPLSLMVIYETTEPFDKNTGLP